LDDLGGLSSTALDTIKIHQYRLFTIIQISCVEMSSLIVSLATKAPRTISFRCAAPFVPATSSLVSFPWQLSVGDINCRSVRHFADSTKGSNEPPFKVTDKEEEEQLEEAMKDVASKTKINTKDLYKHIAEINDLNKNQSKRFVDSLFDTIADVSLVYIKCVCFFSSCVWLGSAHSLT
jgi:hypothetical protein